MKKVITPTFIIFILLFTSCAHNFEVSEDKSYIPPVIKIQPRLIYPKIAQENDYSGTIKLYLQVSPEGEVNKVNLLKTSGYKLLDDVSINYCRQLIFSPGLKDGKPITSRIQWVIKFNLSDQIEIVDNYLTEIKELYNRLPLASNSIKNYIEQEILQKYSQLIGETSDGKYFNNAISQIISYQMTEEWQKQWNSFPLTFLLYQDFIERFKNYTDINTVKNLLKNSLLIDFKYIKDTQASDIQSRANRDALLEKIRKFVAAHYPEINIEGTATGMIERISPVAKL
jgi:TonB family protein